MTTSMTSGQEDVFQQVRTLVSSGVVNNSTMAATLPLPTGLADVMLGGAKRNVPTKSRFDPQEPRPIQGVVSGDGGAGDGVQIDKNRFWQYMEDYFRDVTAADLQPLLATSHDIIDDPDFKLPFLGGHYRQQWEAEDAAFNPGAQRSASSAKRRAMAGSPALKRTAVLTARAAEEQITSVISPQESMTAACDVCGELESEDGNLIVFCDCCNVPVHQQCYGISIVPSGPWLCARCERRPPPLPCQCVLCSVPGGALKPTTLAADNPDGSPWGHVHWAHLFCAQWVPETYIEDTDAMEPVDNLHAVARERWKLVCTLCRQRQGACIQCCYGHCAVSYHATCARRAGVRMEVVSGPRGENLELRSYCGKHWVKLQSLQGASAAGDSLNKRDDVASWLSQAELQTGSMLPGVMQDTQAVAMTQSAPEVEAVPRGDHLVNGFYAAPASEGAVPTNAAQHLSPAGNTDMSSLRDGSDAQAVTAEIPGATIETAVIVPDDTHGLASPISGMGQSVAPQGRGMEKMEVVYVGSSGRQEFDQSPARLLAVLEPVRLIALAKQALNDCGLKQTQVAKQLGTSQSQLSHWMQGRYKKTLPIMRAKLAAWLEPVCAARPRSLAAGFLPPASMASMDGGVVPSMLDTHPTTDAASAPLLTPGLQPPIALDGPNATEVATPGSPRTMFALQFASPLGRSSPSPVHNKAPIVSADSARRHGLVHAYIQLLFQQPHRADEHMRVTSPVSDTMSDPFPMDFDQDQETSSALRPTTPNRLDAFRSDAGAAFAKPLSQPDTPSRATTPPTPARCSVCLVWKKGRCGTENAPAQCKRKRSAMAMAENKELRESLIGASIQAIGDEPVEPQDRTLDQLQHAQHLIRLAPDDDITAELLIRQGQLLHRLQANHAHCTQLLQQVLEQLPERREKAQLLAQAQAEAAQFVAVAKEVARRARKEKRHREAAQTAKQLAATAAASSRVGHVRRDGSNLDAFGQQIPSIPAGRMVDELVLKGCRQVSTVFSALSRKALSSSLKMGDGCMHTVQIGYQKSALPGMRQQLRITWPMSQKKDGHCSVKSAGGRRCNFGHCMHGLHPLCARRTGLYMSVKELSGGRFLRRIYCHRHSPLLRAKVDSQVQDSLEELALLKRIRLDLERVQLLCERVVRRERIKHEIVKASGDAFAGRLQAAAIAAPADATAAATPGGSAQSGWGTSKRRGTPAMARKDGASTSDGQAAPPLLHMPGAEPVQPGVNKVGRQKLDEQQVALPPLPRAVPAPAIPLSTLQQHAPPRLQLPMPLPAGMYSPGFLTSPSPATLLKRHRPGEEDMRPDERLMTPEEANITNRALPKGFLFMPIGQYNATPKSAGVHHHQLQPQPQQQEPAHQQQPGTSQQVKKPKHA
eukprot:jgi/Chlat1/4885/Chrsp31S04906